MTSVMDRRSLLGFLAVGALGGCAPGDEFAEGRRQPAEGGIGGTGIIGTLVDFGSLIVNGLRIELPQDVEVQTALGGLSHQDLRVGHTLTIEAETRDGVLFARRVDLTYPVAGIISSRAASGTTAKVAGVTVMLEPGAGVFPPADTYCAVSGFWDGAKVMASRVDTLPAPGREVVAGTIRGSGNSWTIGGQRVTLPAGAKPENEGYATALGTAGAGAFLVDELRQGRFTGAAGALTRLSVEGYLAPIAEAPFQTVDGLGHSFSADSAVAPHIGRRTLFNGSYDGKFRLAQAVTLSEALPDRRETLRTLSIN